MKKGVVVGMANGKLWQHDEDIWEVKPGRSGTYEVVGSVLMVGKVSE